MARRVLITGATRGLGRVLAEGIAAQGHTVVGCGRDETQLAALRKTLGAPHRFDRADVADDAEVSAWAKAVDSDGAPFDLILNNAAVINRTAPLWETDDGEFRKLVDINIIGVVNVVRHFVPAMVRRKRGVIVNFSSAWGRSTSPDVAPYCGSKYAIEGLTLAMAQELPDGMAAIPLNPGIIDTDMLRSCFGAESANYPSPAKWSKTAVPYVLALGPQHNGQSLSVPV